MYYRIEDAVKNIGLVYPQANVDLDCIGNIDEFHFKEFPSDVRLPHVVLRKGAKFTHLISCVGFGVEQNLIISEELFYILAPNSYGFDFGGINVTHPKHGTRDYYICHPNSAGEQFLDSKRTEYVTEHFENLSAVVVKKAVLKKSIPYDFFYIKMLASGSGFVISENLKEKIDKLKDSGIELFELNTKR